MNKSYITFFVERVPLVPQLILSFGLTTTGLFLSNSTFNTISYLLVALIVFIFLSQLRFMDELKDFEKDKVANPTRPMPRGLISTHQVKKIIKYTNRILLVLNLSLLSFGPAPFLYLALTLVWLQLMFYEFFIGETLSRYPLIYAFSHQIIIVPLILFISSTFNSSFALQESFFCSLMILGSFFAYEVGRKLNPLSHPILKTYLIEYGKMKTFLLSLSLLAFSSFFAFQIGLENIILPLAIVTASSYYLIFKKPSSYKITEGIITLNLIVSIWIIPIKGWLLG